ncbi:hypothetical protein GCM10022247_71630 [Allokutzneria multivorans]|uniref:Prenyltransferase n=1 Tax=Allokutzneria multivorans TaxID=1142134 RepID=A0ABP7U3U2_9PSEU
MAIMMTRRYEDAAHRAVAWLLERQRPDDLACHYKSPAVLGLAGHPREARAALEEVVARFGTADGDFATAEGVKSRNAIFDEFWSYPNGWIALAAQRLGRFGVARGSYEHLLGYRAPDGGFRSNGSAATEPDVLSTAHLGLVALQLGDLGTARAAGLWLSRFLAAGPERGREFLLRANGTGPLEVLSTGAPDQPYFMIGYPIGFLAKLHDATGSADVLATAEGFADYALRCGDNLRSCQLSHKVAWGAALLARATGTRCYVELATDIAEHLLAVQAADGSWSPGAPDVTTFDDTAEIAHWLLEITAELPPPSG